MLRIHYRNPLTKAYQYEYALYSLLAERFAGVECCSRSLTTLRLYYAELVKENEETGHVSYQKQYEIEEEVATWLAQDFDGKVTFPFMKDCRVELAVFRREDGAHTFLFTDGIYGFSVRLKLSRGKYPKGIIVAK